MEQIQYFQAFHTYQYLIMYRGYYSFIHPYHYFQVKVAEDSNHSLCIPNKYIWVHILFHEHNNYNIFYCILFFCKCNKCHFQLFFALAAKSRYFFIQINFYQNSYNIGKNQNKIHQLKSNYNTPVSIYLDTYKYLFYFALILAQSEYILYSSYLFGRTHLQHHSKDKFVHRKYHNKCIYENNYFKVNCLLIIF